MMLSAKIVKIIDCLSPHPPHPHPLFFYSSELVDYKVDVMTIGPKW